MGNNYIELWSGNWLQEGKTTVKKRRRTPSLRYKDVEIIKRLCPGIKHISPTTGTKDVISYKGNSLFVYIKGGNTDFLKILDRKIKRGTFFNENHTKRGARVVVVGSKSAKELFKTLDPIGKTIRIKNVPFRIIGVMEKMENYRGISDPNFDVLIPVRAIKKHVFKRVNQRVHSIIMSAPTKEEIPGLVKQIRKIMRFQRKIKTGEPDNFTIIDQASFLKAAQAGAKTIRLLLLIIASISLLVGGIGIMNIMLVSVSERTREIGIRMALGANSTLILKQFLIEALTICLIGGIIGTLVGVAIPYIVAYFTNWSPIVTTSSIFIAFFTTSIIGVFFGFYPAKRASNLNPVEALAEH